MSPAARSGLALLAAVTFALGVAGWQAKLHWDTRNPEPDAVIQPGETVQPTSVQAPRLVAVCQWPAGTTHCGRCPAARSGPRCWAVASWPFGLVVITSGAPACQCQISVASTRCQAEASPMSSKK